MATSSCTNCVTLLLNNNCSHSLKNGPRSFIRPRRDSHRSAATGINRSPNRNLIVRNATPEAAGDVLSSFSLPEIPGLPLLADNPWLTAVAGLLFGVPFLVQRLLALSKQVDAAAQTVENIADAVGKVADEVDKAAENLAESLPEGGLKKVVTFVEDLAEETSEGAQKVEDLMDKVEELDDKLEEFLNKQDKGTSKV